MASANDLLDFALNLGSTAWRIRVSQGLGDWFGQFVRILELEGWQPGAPLDRNTERRTLYLLPRGERSSSTPPEIIEEDACRDSRVAEWRPTALNRLLWWRHETAPGDILEIPVDDDQDQQVQSISQACFPFYARLVARGGLPLHAALVERGRAAVALAAAGGMGKSTCSRRIPAPWRSVADDLILIAWGGAGSSTFEAHAFPTWSEYFWKRSERSWNTGEAWPLRAVFFLSKKPEDRASSLGQGEAALNLTKSANQILSNLIASLDPLEKRKLLGRVFDNACYLARRLPVFLLEISLTGKFWLKIEERL